MRPEHDRSSFRRAIGVGHSRLWQDAVDRLHQAVTDRGRSHPQELDAGKIGRREPFLFIQHHGDHRRHGGEPRAAIILDGFQVKLRVELRQQNHGCMRRVRQLAHGQRIHVIERCCDQESMPRRVLRGHSRFDHPDMALVREHDALGTPRRTRSVEKHRRFVARCRDRHERTWFQEISELAAFAVEPDTRHILRRAVEAPRVAEHELGA